MYVLYAMVYQVCRIVHIIISCLLQVRSTEGLSTITALDTCQSYILAPSTGHVLNRSKPTIFVLQGDMGGERVLQKKWTTFLKAQLLCSLPDDGFPFNIIQDMFVLTPSPEDWKNTVFYGVFTSQW